MVISNYIFWMLSETHVTHGTSRDFGGEGMEEKISFDEKGGIFQQLSNLY